MILWPIYPVTQKVASFARGPEQEASQQVQAAAGCLLLGPYDLAEIKVSEMSGEDRDAVWSLRKGPMDES